MSSATSAFQTPITIRDTIDRIYRNKYLLPAIQREFVWTPNQIVKLFDSILREYTIGSFLFWNVEKENIKNFQFYEVIRKYHARDNTHNPKANVSGEENLIAILDGQQRLTALYIGLKGTYAHKIHWSRWNNDDAFPTRKLYLNLLSKSPEIDLTYDLRFLTPNEASIRNEKTFWFEVGKVLNFNSMRDINKYLRENKIIEQDFPDKCLFQLYEFVNNKPVINYYLETSQEIEKVLNMFIRINSGGTPLSYSDILLSIATAQWKTKDAREEITKFVDEINRFGNGFKFKKDFVLKSCLVLSGLKGIAFKVDNFNASNMRKIEEKWDDITKSIRLAVHLISSFGYNFKTLASTNAVIPIAYFIMNLGNPNGFVQSSNYSENRELIKKWLRFSLLRRAFSGQPDNVLRPIRKILDSNPNNFPLSAITEHFKGTNKSLTFGIDDIEHLLFYKYGKAHTFSVLSLLYPTLDFRNKFHQDHIFPRSFFKMPKMKKRGIPEALRNVFVEDYNYIGNLQLLEGLSNKEKSNKDFFDWFEETYPSKDERLEFMKKHFIPQDIDLGFANFKQFFDERNKLILKRLKELLA